MISIQCSINNIFDQFDKCLLQIARIFRKESTHPEPNPPPSLLGGESGVRSKNEWL
ncbi:hypothetical protein [Okeania sp. SIO2C2]|uniref:hypothetical protein n=1 Tax=Okeania sp. SIO2C2 TaxID=2607787 RepID=UPI0025803382|nr:hypothetical protein [Okeania sp. SIO2C2]